jgi:hypothetical protein
MYFKSKPGRCHSANLQAYLKGRQAQVVLSIQVGPVVSGRSKVYEKDCPPANLPQVLADPADLNMETMTLKVRSANPDPDPDYGLRSADCQLWHTAKQRK